MKDIGLIRSFPHWTSEGGLDFSIYRRRVEYYANEDADRLNKVENSWISQEISALFEKYLFRFAREKNVSKIF